MPDTREQLLARIRKMAPLYKTWSDDELAARLSIAHPKLANVLKGLPPLQVGMPMSDNLKIDASEIFNAPRETRTEPNLMDIGYDALMLGTGAASTEVTDEKGYIPKNEQAALGGLAQGAALSMIPLGAMAKNLGQHATAVLKGLAKNPIVTKNIPNAINIEVNAAHGLQTPNVPGTVGHPISSGVASVEQVTGAFGTTIAPARNVTPTPSSPVQIAMQNVVAAPFSLEEANLVTALKNNLTIPSRVDVVRGLAERGNLEQAIRWALPVSGWETGRATIDSVRQNMATVAPDNPAAVNARLQVIVDHAIGEPAAAPIPVPPVEQPAPVQQEPIQPQTPPEQPVAVQEPVRQEVNAEPVAQMPQQTTEEARLLNNLATNLAPALGQALATNAPADNIENIRGAIANVAQNLFAEARRQGGTARRTRRPEFYVSLAGINIPIHSPQEAARAFMGATQGLGALMERGMIPQLNTGMLGEINPTIKDAHGNVMGFVDAQGNVWQGHPEDPGPRTPWTTFAEAHVNRPQQVVPPEQQLPLQAPPTPQQEVGHNQLAYEQMGMNLQTAQTQAQLPAPTPPQEPAVPMGENIARLFEVRPENITPIEPYNPPSRIVQRYWGLPEALRQDNILEALVQQEGTDGPLMRDPRFPNRIIISPNSRIRWEVLPGRVKRAIETLIDAQPEGREPGIPEPEELSPIEEVTRIFANQPERRTIVLAGPNMPDIPITEFAQALRNRNLFGSVMQIHGDNIGVVARNPQDLGARMMELSEEGAEAVNETPLRLGPTNRVINIPNAGQPVALPAPQLRTQVPAVRPAEVEIPVRPFPPANEDFPTSPPEVKEPVVAPRPVQPRVEENVETPNIPGAEELPTGLKKLVTKYGKKEVIPNSTRLRITEETVIGSARSQGFELVLDADRNITHINKLTNAPAGPINQPPAGAATQLTTLPAPEEDMTRMPIAEKWKFQMEEVMKNPRVPERMPVADFRSIMKANGVSDEELQWNDVTRDLLVGQTHVTKTAVREWLEKNKFMYQEILLGKEAPAVYTPAQLSDLDNKVITLMHTQGTETLIELMHAYEIDRPALERADTLQNLITEFRLPFALRPNTTLMGGNTFRLSSTGAMRPGTTEIVGNFVREYNDLFKAELRQAGRSTARWTGPSYNVQPNIGGFRNKLFVQRTGFPEQKRMVRDVFKSGLTPIPDLETEVGGLMLGNIAPETMHDANVKFYTVIVNGEGTKLGIANDLRPGRAPYWKVTHLGGRWAGMLRPEETKFTTLDALLDKLISKIKWGSTVGSNAGAHFSEFSKGLSHHQLIVDVPLKGEIALSPNETQSDLQQKARDLEDTAVKKLAERLGITRKEARAQLPEKYGFRTPERMVLDPANVEGIHTLLDMPMSSNFSLLEFKNLMRMAADEERRYIFMPGGSVLEKRWESEHQLRQMLDYVEWKPYDMVATAQRARRIGAPPVGTTIFKKALTMRRFENWLRKAYGPGRRTYSYATLNRYFGLNLSSTEWHNAYLLQAERQTLLDAINARITNRPAPQRATQQPVQPQQQEEYVELKNWYRGEPRRSFIVHRATGKIYFAPNESYLASQHPNAILADIYGAHISEKILDAGQGDLMGDELHMGEGFMVNYDNIYTSNVNSVVPKQFKSQIKVMPYRLTTFVQELAKGLADPTVPMEKIQTMVEQALHPGHPDATRVLPNTGGHQGEMPPLLIDVIHRLAQGTMTTPRDEVATKLKAWANKNEVYPAKEDMEALQRTIATHINVNSDPEELIEVLKDRIFPQKDTTFTRKDGEALKNIMGETLTREKVDKARKYVHKRLFQEYIKRLRERTPGWVIELKPKFREWLRKHSLSYWVALSALGVNSKKGTNESTK